MLYCLYMSQSSPANLYLGAEMQRGNFRWTETWKVVEMIETWCSGSNSCQRGEHYLRNSFLIKNNCRRFHSAFWFLGNYWIISQDPMRPQSYYVFFPSIFSLSSIRIPVNEEQCSWKDRSIAWITYAIAMLWWIENWLQHWEEKIGFRG